MSKPVKNIIVRDYQNRLGDAQDGMLISIRGLKAKDQSTIRTTLAKKKIKVVVVRNALVKRAMGESGLTKLDGLLTGSNALAFGGTSVVEVAREIVELVKTMPGLELKGAVLDGQLFEGKKGVEELSKFPTKDEAIGQVVTLVVGPGRKLVAQLKGPGSSLAGIIKAIEQKLEKGEAIAKKAG